MRYHLFLIVLLPLFFTAAVRTDYKTQEIRFPTYKGLVMTGYQGWFNTSDDGAGRGWFHYQRNGKFEPGNCTIEFWPEMYEYEIQYETAFRYPDGRVATVFSSYDYSTVDTHFRWMKEYDIDGAFLQRYMAAEKSASFSNNAWQILKHTLTASKKYDRVISIMYAWDVNFVPGDEEILIRDWKRLVDELDIKNPRKYNILYHNGKPLVTLWGAGFAGETRRYDLDEVEKIVDFLSNDPDYGGCSVMLGVPTTWRDPLIRGSDAVNDPRLMQILEKVDIIAPWHVDRYRGFYLREGTYQTVLDIVGDDIAWCKANGKDYAPCIFPGCSMLNLRNINDPESPEFFHWSPRLKGEYMWMMVANAVRHGADMLYIAMFDEIDEGTAIFKITNDPPRSDPKRGGSYFFDLEGMPSDHYLWLSGMAGKMMRGEILFTDKVPQRK